MGVTATVLRDAAPGEEAPPPPSSGYDAFRQQLALFLSDIRSQSQLPVLRSYLKLYRSVTILKLASLLQLEEKTVRAQLMYLKRCSQQLEWDGGASVLDGKWVFVGDIDFHIDGDVVHVVVKEVGGRVSVEATGEFLRRHIHKSNELLVQLTATFRTMPPAVPI